MSRSPTGDGLFASLRQLLATSLEMAQVRAQLLGNEIQQEKLRIFGGLLLAGIGLVLLAVGTLLLCGLVLMLVADGYRLAALAVLTLAFLAGGALAMRAGGQRLRGSGQLFEASRAELARDLAALAPVRQEPR